MKKYVCIHINTAILVLFHLCQEKEKKRKAIGGIVLLHNERSKRIVLPPPFTIYAARE